MPRGPRRRRGGKRRGPTRATPRVEPTGIIHVNRRGYAFVETAEGEFFVQRERMLGAFDGDLVALRPHGAPEKGHRRSAGVSRVLQRNTPSLVGVYERNGSLGIVRPADPRISHDVFVDAEAFPTAVSGDMVSVRLLVYPSRHESAMGEITEIIGHEGDPDMRVRVLLRRHGIETVFSEAAHEEAAVMTLDVDEALREPDRVDLRDRPILTVDPVDARDFDDAVSCSIDGDGLFHLGVHIADVSEYVTWGSSIDLDARRRATSVYLVDRVVPMLPEELSCGLCSLVPGEDRLAFSVDMVVDPSGELVSCSFRPSVIRSRLRLDYDRVERCLEGDESWPSAQAGSLLTALDALAAIRFSRRIARGGIDLDNPEVKVDLDATGSVTALRLRRRTRATGAIEEAMILANEAVATFLEPLCAHVPYRVHQAPSKDAMAALVPLLVELGYPTAGLLDADPHAVQAVLDRARMRPEKDLVTMRVLRSLRRAVYSPENIGHYGLGSPCYCHFTSPIRRYPDLIVHRMLRAVLLGACDRTGEVRPQALRGLPGAVGGVDGMAGQMAWLCRHSSEMERVAQEAASDSLQTKLCEYMQGFIGEEFSGIVTSVSSAGLFVTLENTVKGLVRIQTLGDEYFVHDPDHQTLVGEDSGIVYRIGQRVQVTLTAVSVDEMTIDLLLV